MKLEGVVKRFGRTDAVRGLDLEVSKGSIFGLLGPNGAGKTTALRVLLGLARADAGRMWLLGERVPTRLDRVVPKVGAVLQEPGLHPDLTASQTLRTLARTGDSGPRVDGRALLSRLGLEGAMDRRVRGFSAGMRQRLAIAAALLRDPELIVLDEPTTSLDPLGVQLVRKVITWLKERGRTVLISSHVLSEVEMVCDAVGLLQDGKLLAAGAIGQLTSSAGLGERTEVLVADARRARVALEDAGLRVADDDGALLVEGASPERVGKVLGEGGIYPRGLKASRGSLEQVFAHYFERR